MRSDGKHDKSNTSGAKLHALDRRRRCVDLRIAGWDLRAIAAKVGCSKSTVERDVLKALEERAGKVGESADVMIAQEKARLDELQSSFWAAALKGDVKAAGIVLSVMDRRARLLGLDAPKKLDHEVNGAAVQTAVVIIPSNGREG